MFGKEEDILGKALEELTGEKVLPKRDIGLSTSYALSVMGHPAVKELLTGHSGSAEITLHSIKEGFREVTLILSSSKKDGVRLYIDLGNYSYKVIERPEEEIFGMLVRFFRNPLLGGSFSVREKERGQESFLPNLVWIAGVKPPFEAKKHDITSFNKLALKLESSSLNDWEDVYEAIFGMIHFINSFAQDKDDMDSLVYLMLSLMEFSNLLGVEWDKEVEYLYESTGEPQLDLLSAVKTFSMLPFINAREVPASLNMAFSKILASTGMSLDRLYALVIENASSYVEVDDSWL